MNDPTLKPSELKLLLRNDGIKYYRWVGFLRDGKLLLERTISKREVIGKILTTPSEGELCIWPQLQHENINRLLEVLCINDSVKILISPFIGNTIGNLICADSFNKQPDCFDRKKSYAKDILSALNYMHKNSVFHLNLSDENVAVCPYSDKAILCDFSFAIAQEKVTKAHLPPNRHYQSPEVENGGDDETFDSLPIDIWDCGILLLQIFTQHQLPWRGAVSDSLEFLDDIEIVKKTNSGANIDKKETDEFKAFIQDLLSQDPFFRPTAKKALQSCFLQTVYNQLDEKARQFWKNGNTSNFFMRADCHIDVENPSDVDVNLSEGIYLPKSDKGRLIWTKSEPDNNLHRQAQNSTLPGYVSSPTLARNSDTESASSKKKINYREPMEWITELELGNPFRIENDLSYIPYSEMVISKEDQLSNYPSCSLEQIIPHIISMTGLNHDVPSSKLYNSPSSVIERSHRNSESNVAKADMDAWIDIPLQKNHPSPPLQSNTISDGKMIREKDFSRKNRLDLSPGRPTHDILKICDESPKLVDKRYLYTKRGTKTDKNQCRVEEIAVSQRKNWSNTTDDKIEHRVNVTPPRRKWYHNLCCGCGKKRIK